MKPISKQMKNPNYNEPNIEGLQGKINLIKDLKNYLE
jgi:hypothetical protein